MAGSDIKLSYDTITGVAGTLAGAGSALVQEVQMLQTRVDGLLQQDGGMWLNQTSPAVRVAYDNFSASANQMAESVSSFSDMFNAFVLNMQSMDEKMAYSIQHPPPSS